MSGWLDAARALRAARYDVALDFQGLMKSAVLARASGAKRVLGFSIWHLREKTARPFYSESIGSGRRFGRTVMSFTRTCGCSKRWASRSRRWSFRLLSLPSAGA